jgi:hypothetical protein
MRNAKRTLVLVAVSVAATVAASALYAHDGQGSSGSMMSNRMMGGNMMGRTSRMMDRCGSMMQGGSRGDRPNDQWRQEPPPAPEKNR